jgi:hypothetical protein
VLWIPAVAALLLAASGAKVAAQADSTAGNGPAYVDPETAPRPMMRATRITQPIVIDGRIDEPAWLDADSIGGFIQSQPRRGYLATYPTVVRVLYDARYLYISALCYDPEPEELTIPTLEQGFDSRESDVFGITLDTFLDRRNSFMFLINPGGAVRYGQTFDNSRTTDLAWRGVIHVRTQVHEEGWTVELAIPWTTLRYDPTRAEQAWGINFVRRVRRKNEDSYWAPLDRRDPVHRMSRAGTLTGLGRLPVTRNLSLKPYLLAGNASGRQLTGPERGADLDGGADLKYGVTPRLTLDLTYRTDFSQVEVDQEQVNLTRFSLFFPEKRDFFVENSGVFTFGDVTEREYRMGTSLRDFTLFHSRSIGLKEGRPVPILGGGRLTGRAAGFELGLLNMQTEQTPISPAENFAVARVRRNLFGSVDVGGMFINRQATSGGGFYNRSWGVDASTQLWNRFIVSSYLAGTDGPGAEPGGSAAGRVIAAWRDRVWDVSAMYKQVGDSFDPGVGFIRRRGMKQSYATFGAHPRPRLPFVQESNPYVEVDYITDMESVLETRTLTLGNGVDFHDGGTLSAVFADRYERLDRPFRINANSTVPAGKYDFREGRLQYQSSLARAFAANASLGGGGYFHGERLSLGLGTIWRPNHKLSLELRADHNNIQLPDTEFRADIYAMRLRYSHSTTLFGSAFVQYNQALEQVVTNLRLNLIHAPLSDLFLVFTERRGVGGAESGVLERFLTAKVTKMVAF